jgi:hypothetical protein
MRNAAGNILHNPRFDWWPWGSSGFVSSGKTAARWKLERTSVADVVEVKKAQLPRSERYDPWLRGANTMRVAVTALDAATTLRIRQFLEGYSLFGQNMLRVTVIATGPNGGKFHIGAGENYAELRTYGDDYDNGTYVQTGTSLVFTRATHRQQVGDTIKLNFTTGGAVSGEFTVTASDSDTLTVTALDSAARSGSGRIVVPRLTVRTIVVPFDDPQFEYLRITPFETPNMVGDYQLVYADVQVSGVTEPAEFYPRTPWEELERMKRYLTPITQAMFATGASTTSMRMPVRAPIGGWRVPPVIGPVVAASYSVTLNSGGTVIVNSAPTYSMAANPTASVDGCVLALGGFSSSIVSASQYVLGPITEPICWLDTEGYF